jgi:hypothetical protein
MTLHLDWKRLNKNESIWIIIVITLDSYLMRFVFDFSVLTQHDIIENLKSFLLIFVDQMNLGIIEHTTELIDYEFLLSENGLCFLEKS